ncbi:hypothetical protein DL95DRAFT_430556 [Leptodontidium sp. 2 PMI_412]|nr:hypothetical protein BKA61DRAFT_637738 [Leptodontidium sp. MPI-SDFR-AT-0119]KAH9203808.1 hypothetical protein DL95DRAFT_430556 [Leptodontidium sp. 2 PMI_412]
MTVTVLRYHGEWDATSRENRALRFVEPYTKEMTSNLTLLYASTKYFSPSCAFHDTTNVTYRGAENITTWVRGLFSLCIAVGESEEQGNSPKYTVIGEFHGKYWFRGDGEPILAPRAVFFTIVASETEDGFDGLQFSELNLYWNTVLVKDEKVRRSRSRHE